MKFSDIIRSFANKGHTYHIISRYDKICVYYGSFENCRKALKQESNEFRKAHIIVSDKKYNRIIRRKPTL